MGMSIKIKPLFCISFTYNSVDKATLLFFIYQAKGDVFMKRTIKLHG